MFLPDMTGTDLVLEIRDNPLTLNTPFMLISTVTTFAELEPIKQAGATAILPKPFKASDLQRAIMTTMDWENPQAIDLNGYDTASLRLLLVDDSMMARNMISRTLNKMGLHSIDEAENGRLAIPMIQQVTYDLIITDYNMPEMDGHELLEYIRKQSQQPDVPVLMVTTEGDQHKLEGVQQAGVSAIVDKPFETPLIKQLIERVLVKA
jgi:two-component system chemotaxis response regulator CheY